MMVNFCGPGVPGVVMFGSAFSFGPGRGETEVGETGNGETEDCEEATGMDTGRDVESGAGVGE